MDNDQKAKTLLDHNGESGAVARKLKTDYYVTESSEGGGELYDVVDKNDIRPSGAGYGVSIRQSTYS